MANIAAVRAALGDLALEEKPGVLLKKSRDFYWYSPILKRQLDDVCAELMVSPAERGGGYPHSQGLFRT